MIDYRMAALAAAMSAVAGLTPALAEQGGADTAAPQRPGATRPQAGVSDAVVQKVGTALKRVATIRQSYAERTQSTTSPQERQTLTQQAHRDMVNAISDQGLSVQQYNQVVQMAQADPTLQQRLLSAAQQGH